MKKRDIKPEILSKLGLSNDYAITKQLIKDFGKLYSGKPYNLGKPKEVRYGDKLSALSLIKQKRINGIPAKDVPEGFIYILSNPVWKGYYKIGFSIDPRDRLKQYQTGCPFNDYKLEGWYFSFNVKQTEKEIHKRLQEFNVTGEWFKLDLENLRKFILRQDDIMN